MQKKRVSHDLLFNNKNELGEHIEPINLYKTYIRIQPNNMKYMFTRCFPSKQSCFTLNGLEAIILKWGEVPRHFPASTVSCVRANTEPGSAASIVNTASAKWCTCPTVSGLNCFQAYTIFCFLCIKTLLSFNSYTQEKKYVNQWIVDGNASLTSPLAHLALGT